MSEFNNPATNTAVTTIDITAAELVGANKGQRPDLIVRPGAIYRTPDGKLYSAQSGQLLPANNLTATLAIDPLTGRVGFSGLPAVDASVGGRKLGIIGDSRAASAYNAGSVTSINIAGTAMTVVQTGIGGAPTAVGRTVVLGTIGSNAPLYIRGKVASITDANTIVVTAQYPVTLPQGAISIGNANVYVEGARPINLTSYISHFVSKLNQPFQSVISAAYPGAITSGALYQARDLVAQGCDTILICPLGYNDYNAIGGNLTGAQVWEWRKSLYRELQGCKIIDCLEPPCGTADANKIVNIQRIKDLNTLMQANAAAYGVTLVDLYAPLYDSATGYALANTLYDGVHPSPYGARLAVDYNLANFAPLKRPMVTIDSTGQFDSPVTNTALSPVGSALPTGWSEPIVPAGITRSVTALPSGIGNQYSAALTGTASQTYYLDSPVATVVTGGNYRAAMRLAMANGVGIQDMFAVIMDSSNAVIFALLRLSNNTTNSLDGTWELVGEDTFVIPAATTTAKFRLYIAFSASGGSGTVTVSNYDFRPATAPA